MSGSGGLQVTPQATAVEGMDGVIELVGTIFARGVLIAATLSVCRGPTEIFGAGAAMEGWGVMVGAGGELIWRAVTGRGMVSIDASTLGGRSLRRIKIVRGRFFHF